MRARRRRLVHAHRVFTIFDTVEQSFAFFESVSDDPVTAQRWWERKQRIVKNEQEPLVLREVARLDDRGGDAEWVSIRSARSDEVRERAAAAVGKRPLRSLDDYVLRRRDST